MNSIPHFNVCIDRLYKLKVTNVKELNYTKIKDVANINRIFHPVDTEHTFSSAEYGNSSE